IAVQALHWFNPLVWFVVSRFQADRELRCDAGALALLSPAERLDYGHTLLRIQETFFAPPAIAGLAPCVRNHPTLRQRILMITHPTTRQPWLHALLVLTLSVLVCYSFTTARAQEKEVPAKVRGGETVKKPGASGGSETPGKKPATREGEGGMKKTGNGEREGGKPSAERDGGTKKPGARDGEGGVKKPGTGDGEGTKKPGARDGEGGVKKPGMKDGEKPRTGERDGEKPRTGERDGEGGAKKPGARDGEGSAKLRKGEGDSASVKSSEVITMHVTADGDTVLINGEKRSTSGLRGFLSTFLPDHPGAKVIVSGDPDTPLKSLHQIVDAVRDNGNKNVGIKAE
ncbi:MAG: M56 family metallopeptidase, partial [Prosthecobacter sp.]|nr:M56 family metallopeptidase [Prosthecobacter sp.]